MRDDPYRQQKLLSRKALADLLIIILLSLVALAVAEKVDFHDRLHQLHSHSIWGLDELLALVLVLVFGLYDSLCQRPSQAEQLKQTIAFFKIGDTGVRHVASRSAKIEHKPALKGKAKELTHGKANGYNKKKVIGLDLELGDQDHLDNEFEKY